jgi:hypothetical protein
VYVQNSGASRLLSVGHGTPRTPPDTTRYHRILSHTITYHQISPNTTRYISA